MPVEVCEPGSNLVVFEHVWKTYAHGASPVNAVQDLSFRIGQGEFVAIMGPSGSGKSTTLHLLGFLDRPSQGRIFWEGSDASRLSEISLARLRNQAIGFVFQSFNLLPRMSVLENVELPLKYGSFKPKEHRARAREALRLVGLEKEAFRRPNQISGGQQQRVAIARALVTGAKMILADEPTGNLDSKSSQDIMQLFSHLNRSVGCTIILVTHNPEVASWARRQLQFRDGRLVADSSWESSAIC